MIASFELSPLWIALVVPFLAVLGIMVGAPAQRIGVVACAFNLVLSLGLLIAFFQHSGDAPDGSWIGFGTNLGGVPLTFLVVVYIIGLVQMLTVSTEVRHPGLKMECLLLVIGGAAFSMASGNLTGCVFALLVPIMPLFLHLGKWGGHNRQGAAFQWAMSWCLALCLITAAMAGDGVASPYSQVLVVLGFGIMVGLVPGHGWLLMATSAASLSTGFSITGMIPLAAFYGLYRISPGFGDSAHYVMICVGVLSAGYGGWMSVEQKEIKHVLASTSIALRGVMFLGLGCGKAVGAEGALLLCLGEALTSTCLVTASAELEQAVGENRVRELLGKGRLYPKLTGFSVAGMLMALGFPGSLNLLGGLMILHGCVAARSTVAIAGIAVGVAASGLGLIRMIRSVYFSIGSVEKSTENVKHPVVPIDYVGQFQECLPYLALLVTNVLLGLNIGNVLERIFSR